MGKPAARMGDTTAHGGTIVVGCPTVLICNQPAACLGDNHVCPMQTPGTPPIPHVGGPITGPGAPTVLIGGKPAAVVGDMCVCTGPPDTIVKGAPTVLIGAGGGGGGGGGSSSSGSATADPGQSGQSSAETGEGEDSDSDSDTGVFFSALFEDDQGFPISGPQYTIEDPDGGTDSGVLSGGALRRENAADGDHTVSIRTIIACKWSTLKAKVGEEVTLTVETLGVPDGETATLRIFERDIGRPDKEIETFEDVAISGEEASATWTYQYQPKCESRGSDGYSNPGYFIRATVGELTADSSILTITDDLTLELKNHDGSAAADEPYEVYLCNGEVRRGTLDGSGKAEIKDTPPGPWDVRFPHRFRVIEKG